MALTSAALLGVLLASREHPYAKDCQRVLREAVRVAKPCTTHSDQAGTYATAMAAEQYTGQCHAVKMSVLLREGRAIRRLGSPIVLWRLRMILMRLAQACENLGRSEDARWVLDYGLRQIPEYFTSREPVTGPRNTAPVP